MRIEHLPIKSLTTTLCFAGGMDIAIAQVGVATVECWFYGNSDIAPYKATLPDGAVFAGAGTTVALPYGSDVTEIVDLNKLGAECKAQREECEQDQLERLAARAGVELANDFC